MAKKLPNSSTISSLIPTKEEIREILVQMLQAQIEKPDPMKVPVAILQAWAGRIVLKAFSIMEGEYSKSLDQFKDEVEKAIKEFEDEASR